MLARALGPQDRGHLALLILLANLAAEVGALGLPFAASNSVARVPGRAVEILNGLRRPLVRRMVAATALGAILLAALTLDKPSYVQVGAVVAAGGAVLIMLQAYGVGVLQGLRRFVPFNVLRTVPNFAFVVGIGAALLLGAGNLVPLTIAWLASMAVVVP